MSLEHLNNSTFPALRDWLSKALRDLVPLPKLAPDESPDVAILAAEHTLDKPTRRDLERSCRELTRDFIRTGEGSAQYVQALLRLTAGLRLIELAGELAEMARRFAGFPHLDKQIRQSILATLIDLKAMPPEEFWTAFFEQDPSTYAGAALSGLLARNWRSGLELLRRWPGNRDLASVAATIVEQTLEDLSPSERATCLGELQRAAPGYEQTLRAMILELVHEYIPLSRPSEDLRERLKQVSQSVSGFLGISQSSRLLPVYGCHP